MVYISRDDRGSGTAFTRRDVSFVNLLEIMLTDPRSVVSLATDQLHLIVDSRIGRNSDSMTSI